MSTNGTTMNLEQRIMFKVAAKEYVALHREGRHAEAFAFRDKVLKEIAAAK
jgi:hypothetical protein